MARRQIAHITKEELSDKDIGEQIIVVIRKVNEIVDVINEDLQSRP